MTVSALTSDVLEAWENPEGIDLPDDLPGAFLARFAVTEAVSGSLRIDAADPRAVIEAAMELGSSHAHGQWSSESRLAVYRAAFLHLIGWAGLDGESQPGGH